MSTPRSTIIAALRPPTGSRLRADAPLDTLHYAVARALCTQMITRDRWLELASLVDEEERIRQHPRLLRALAWGDDDYPTCVDQVVPVVLGQRIEETDGIWGVHQEVFLDHLTPLETYLDLPAWLSAHAPQLYRVLYGTDPAAAAALDGVADVTAGLDLTEIVRQLDRLRRDLADDLPAAVGHAKELVESACKTVLGQTGPGAGALKFPALVTAALQATGRHPIQIDPADPDAGLLRRLLGGLSSQLEAIAELRNRAGTGHGRAGDVPLDAPLAQLVITQALAAVTYLLQASDLSATSGGAPGGPAVPAGGGA